MRAIRTVRFWCYLCEGTFRVPFDRVLSGPPVECSRGHGSEYASIDDKRLMPREGETE